MLQTQQQQLQHFPENHVQNQNNSSQNIPLFVLSQVLSSYPQTGMQIIRTSSMTQDMPNSTISTIQEVAVLDTVIKTLHQKCYSFQHKKCNLESKILTVLGITNPEKRSHIEKNADETIIAMCSFGVNATAIIP